MINRFISAVVPVYRSRAMLFELTERISAVLSSIATQYEIIYVEDCGGDDSWEMIKELSVQNSSVKGVMLSRNYGQHNALLCGIRAAKGDIIVTLDDDLQNPPEEIPKLIAELQRGYDVVYGYPAKETHGFFRDCASRITKFALQDSMGMSVARKVSAFRAFNTRLRDAFNTYQSPSVNIEVLLTWATSNFSAVEVKQNNRAQGVSGYTFRKLVSHAINMLTGFSTIPLRIASMLGLLFGALGLIILSYVIVQYILIGSAVPGFTFIVSVVCIFSGVQLFTIGVIGEYISRMHFRMMNRPAYFSKEYVNLD